MKQLENTVALVAGASRGVGKGIALGLGEAGATVYVTGRTRNDSGEDNGTIDETAEEVTELGGNGISLQCDHTDDEETKEVFGKIKEQHGALDILVNSVWGGYETMFNEQGEYTWERPFWEQPIRQWDSMFASGVRAHYVCSRFAAGLMVPNRHGLIVHLSYWSARKFMGNVAYGVSKAATDKMTADMAHSLRPHNVAAISLYPGLVRTERVMAAAEYLDLGNSESPQFLGRVVAGLANDPDLMEKSGSVHVAAKLAEAYGIEDIDGRQPRPLTLDEA